MNPRVWTFIISTALIISVSEISFAQKREPYKTARENADTHSRKEIFRLTVSQCWPLWRGAVKNFRGKKELSILAGATGAGIIAWQFNGKITERLKNDDAGYVTTAGDVYGRSVNLGLAQFGVYLFGLGIKNESIREFGSVTSHSAILSGIFTGTLKFLVNSKRPEGGDHSRFTSSFPSGHATGAASLAGTVHYRYGALKALPFHLAAIFTGLTRIVDNKHRPYEIIAGWGLGYMTGIGFARAWEKMHEEEVRKRFSLLPSMDHEGRGWLTFQYRFGDSRKDKS